MRGTSRRRRRGCSPLRAPRSARLRAADPTKIVRRFAAWKSAVAAATSPCSSPTSSGTTARCTPMYGAMKMPLAATSASRAQKGSRSSAWRTGIAAKSGTRARSQRSIVRRVPTRPAIAPPQKPSTAIGTISAISTQVMRCGEPVVRSTNHGSASQVICVPVDEITSAASSTARRRSLKRLTIRRLRRS